MDKQVQKELLDSTPPHLRDARSKGSPSLGAGAIYPVPLSDILVDPFQIPAFWSRCYALDQGWNRTACLWAALDRSIDCWYLYTEHYRGKAEPSIHATAIKARGEWIPGLIDPSARGRSQGDGEQLIVTYGELGLKLEAANNAVEAGLYDVWERLSTGRLKVFHTLQNWQAEYRLYRRDEKGNVVKEFDHLMDCFDAETDVLTETGWKRFADLTGSERLATVNLDTDAIEYQVPTELIARPYVGRMVRILGRKLDALVTPTHRMVVYPRDAERPIVKMAQDLSIWDRIKLRGTWVGKKREEVPVQTAYGKPETIDPLVWGEFLGWYVAEGWHASKPQIPGRGYQVGIAQTAAGKIDVLRPLLARTPWHWCENKSGFYTSCKWLWESVRELGNVYEKFVPQWVRESESAIIEAFLRGAVCGDGWVQHGRRSYATVSKPLADGIQELFFKTGVTASVRLGRRGQKAATVMGRVCDTVDQYWVSEWRSPYGLLRDSTNKPNFNQERYAGMVHCATVPNGTLVIRRNGKPMIAGNCMRYIILSGRARAIPYPVDKSKLGMGSRGDPALGF